MANPDCTETALQLSRRFAALLLLTGLTLGLLTLGSPDYSVELKAFTRAPHGIGVRLQALRLRYQGRPILAATAIDLHLGPNQRGVVIEGVSPSLHLVRTSDGLLQFGGHRFEGSAGRMGLFRWLSTLQLESGELTLVDASKDPSVIARYEGISGHLEFDRGQPVAGALRIAGENGAGLSLEISPAAPDASRSLTLALSGFQPALFAPLQGGSSATLNSGLTLSGAFRAELLPLKEGTASYRLSGFEFDHLSLQGADDSAPMSLIGGSIRHTEIDLEGSTLSLQGIELRGLSHDVTRFDLARCDSLRYSAEGGLRMEGLQFAGLSHRRLHLQGLRIPLIFGAEPGVQLDIPQAELDGLSGRLFTAGVLTLRNTQLRPEEGRFVMEEAAAEAVKGEFVELRSAKARTIDYDYRVNQLMLEDLVARRAVAEGFEGNRIRVQQMIWQPDLDRLQLKKSQLVGTRLKHTWLHRLEVEDADMDLDALRIRLGTARIERLIAPALTASVHRVPTRIKTLDIDGIDLDLPARRWRADEVRVKAPHMRLDDDPATRRMLGGQTLGRLASASGKDGDWRYALSRLTIEQGRLMLRVKHQAGARWALKQISLTADDLDPAARDEIDLEFRCRLGTRGRIHLAGRIRQDSLGGLLDLDLEEIRLRPFRSLLPVAKTLEIDKGRLALSGLLRIDALDGGHLEFKGDAKATHFKARAPGTDRTLLAFESLILDDLEISLPARVFSVRIIDLVKGYVHAEIDEHHHLNLASLWDSSESSPSQKEGQAPLNGSVSLLRILSSRLDYTDRVFEPDLMTTVRRLEGTVRGISTRETARAQISLEGLINRDTPMRIFGWMAPLRPREDTDLKVQFQGLDLTSFDQFAGQFAGYKVERGKLTLDLRYTLKDRQLSIEDSLMLNRLTLGESMQQEHRPLVDLALWLLEDSEGNLDLDLPVTGDLEDPTFSLSALYLSAIEHLPYRLLHTPVGLLTALVPTEERTAEVDFAAGQRMPLDPEMRSLLGLIEALREDDSAVLEIEPSADPDTDGPPLAAELLKERRPGRRDSKDEKRMTGASGEKATPDDLRALAYDRAEAIRASLVDQYGVPASRIYQKPLILRPQKDTVRLSVHLGAR